MFANFLLRSKTAAASTKDAFFVLHGLGAIVGSAQFSLAKAEITSGSSISQETPKIAVSFFYMTVCMNQARCCSITLTP